MPPRSCASAAFLAGLAVPDIAARGGRLQLAELAAGIRHLRDEPALRGPFPAIVIASAGIGMAEVIPFAAVTDGLGRDSAFLGILSACHGAGAIVAGLAIPRLIAARGEIVAMSAAAATGALGMVLFALPSTLSVLAASTLFGACLAGALVAWFTHLQRRTPDELRGRAMAAAEMLLTLPYVGSIAAGAALVGLVDFRLLSLAGAVALALCAVRIVYSRSRMMPDRVVDRHVADRLPQRERADRADRARLLGGVDAGQQAPAQRLLERRRRRVAGQRLGDGEHRQPRLAGRAHDAVQDQLGSHLLHAVGGLPGERRAGVVGALDGQQQPVGGHHGDSALIASAPVDGSTLSFSMPSAAVARPARIACSARASSTPAAFATAGSGSVAAIAAASGAAGVFRSQAAAMNVRSASCAPI